ncbi:inactive serine/threonine-protein kinase TEX14-like isoform X2 [Lissotriton helveticus]
MPKDLRPPSGCPVELGLPIDDSSFSAHLHIGASKGQLGKVKKILHTGMDVDSENSAGQTPLFLAALFGQLETADFLLLHGANPNHRCSNGSTPVHAACFSCKPSLLLKLYEAGGDLRLHDGEGRSTHDWAKAAGRDRNCKVLDCLQQCLVHTALLFRCISDPSMLPANDEVRNRLSLRSLRVSPSSWRPRSPRHLMFRRQCLNVSLLSRLIGSTPVAADIELLRSYSERDQTYENGPYSLMRNLLWRGQFVTVRELKQPLHPRCNKPRGTIDLLITEQQHCRNLHHPNLLLLIAVCSSPDMGILRLVYERVEITSLYCLLHTRRNEFPALREDEITLLLLQICEALMFLHSQGYIHRALTSHAVQLVTCHTAKLSNLEYMQPSTMSCTARNIWLHTIPAPLFNWLAPEVIEGRPASLRSDFYSFCTIMQETFTGTIPWSGADGLTVKKMVESGLSLAADASVPRAYFHVLETGLSRRERDRTLTLQDVRYSLRSDVKDTASTSAERPASQSLSQGVPTLYPLLDANRINCLHQDSVDARNPPCASSKHAGVPYFELDARDMKGPERDVLSGHDIQCRPSLGEERHSDCLESSPLSSASLGSEQCPSRRSDDTFARPAAWILQTSTSTSSESSWILETTEEDTEGDELRTEHGSEHSSLGYLEANTDTSSSSPGIAKEPPLDSSVLPQEHFISSLQESTTLLEKADTSLQLLERHFLKGIGVLEAIANHTELCSAWGATASVQLDDFANNCSTKPLPHSTTKHLQHGPTEVKPQLSKEQRPPDRMLKNTGSVTKIKILGPPSEVKASQKKHKGDQMDGARIVSCTDDGGLDDSAIMSHQELAGFMRPPTYPRLKSNLGLKLKASSTARKETSKEVVDPVCKGLFFVTQEAEKRADTGIPRGQRQLCCEVKQVHSLSLQSIIDLTHRSRQEDRQQFSKDVPEVADVFQSPNALYVSSEKKSPPDRPFTELQSLDLMQEIIDELAGAGEPSTLTAIWCQDYVARKKKQIGHEVIRGEEQQEA